MKKLLWHHHVSARDIEYSWFIEHCKMIAWILENQDALTFEAYKRRAGQLGIEHINEEYFTKYTTEAK